MFRERAFYKSCEHKTDTKAEWRDLFHLASPFFFNFDDNIYYKPLV